MPLGKTRAIVSPARKLVACVAGKCEFAARGQSCIRAGERRIAPPALRLAPLFERYAKPVFFLPNDATMTPALIDLHDQHEIPEGGRVHREGRGQPRPLKDCGRRAYRALVIDIVLCGRIDGWEVAKRAAERAYEGLRFF